jgi:hypothetical protein
LYPVLQPQLIHALLSPLVQKSWCLLRDHIDCKIYNRYGLAAGTSFSGPAVIEERESTVVAGPDTTISVDDHLNLIIDIHYPQDKA